MSIISRWWMADVLGIIFMTPIILVWYKPTHVHFFNKRVWEHGVLLSMTFLVAQNVFLDGSLINFQFIKHDVVWVMPFIIWAGLRASVRVTSLVLLMILSFAMWGAHLGIGSFAQVMDKYALVNFWMFGMVLTSGGMTLSIMTASTLKTSEQQRRLFETVSASMDEIYMFSAKTFQYFFVNRGALNNLGFSRQELMQKTPLDLMPNYTTDSLELLLLPLKSKQLIELTFQAQHQPKVGKDYPVEVHLQLFDDNEEPYFLAIVHDITQRKQAEEKLQLSARVFSHAHEGIMITDAENNIIDVNPVFSEITGFSREELIGKNPSVLSSGKHTDEFYKEMWQLIIKQGFWKGEVWNRKKNGELFVELNTISAIYDEKGHIQNYIGLFFDITQNKLQQQALELMANYDVLTKLPNRTLFADRFNQAIARCKRDKTILAIGFLDLDGFKQVNDTYGHAAGDLVLVEVAERIKTVLREEDTVSRLGGDEFGLLLSELESLQHCEQVMTRIHQAISGAYVVTGQTVSIGASSGVTLYPQDNTDPDTLLRHADQAMYQAKLMGKNRFHFFALQDRQ
jgi:diguanylate cyclase (GGDEF)-like protein/PAS domain S-box-containing protein